VGNKQVSSCVDADKVTVTAQATQPCISQTESLNPSP
jgi:hypothetical protein